MGQTEVAADAGLVVGVGGHRHDAPQAHAAVAGETGSDVAKKIKGLVGQEAELRLLLSYMQLHEAGDVAAAAKALLGNLLEEAGRVHAVDERHVGREVFHLVGLQVADEVPLDALAALFPVEQRGQRAAQRRTPLGRASVMFLICSSIML